MVLADSKLSANDMDGMIKDVEGIKGVNNVIGLQSIVGPAVPEEILPQKAVDTFKSGKYQMLMINTKYKVASNAVNKQITQINTAVHKYDSKAMVIGEGPLTKDLIKITDKDFKIVTWISLLAIFIILGFVLQSFSLPFILVAVIQMAIFVNLGIPHYTGTSLAFIASICIGTIQLGSCVNYAILMTTRYKAERYAGKLKREAIETAHSTSVTSVIISATGFFAATFGVAVYSDIEIISSMCLLLARGALISATMVIFVLPALLYLLDGLIIKTSRGFKKKEIEGAE